MFGVNSVLPHVDLYEYRSEDGLFHISSKYAQNKKDINNFQLVVKKFFTLCATYHLSCDKDHLFDAEIESLNNIFKKEMSNIDLEYDHVHFPDLDIKYFVDEDFNLSFYISDSFNKWKTFIDKSELFFKIEVKNDFAITTNSDLELSDIPNEVQSYLENAFKHICCNIKKYTECLYKKAESIKKDIIEREFYGKV